MQWLEISVQCDSQATEAVGDLFDRFGGREGAQNAAVVEVSGFDAVGELLQPVYTVRTYLPQEPETDRRRQEIERGLWLLSRFHAISEPHIRLLAEEDWATAWRAHYKPIAVGQRLLIVPAWQMEAGQVEIGPGALPIVLDPGMAFGTGQHASTRLCLAALERYLRPGDAVLDVGCGSGVLAIAAARLGAGAILATDTDPVAVAATVENSRRNGLAAQVQAQQGSLPRREERPGGWQVIVVNILAEVIVQLLADGLGDLLAAEGHLILSGVIRSAAEEVMAGLARHHLAVVERLAEGEWVGLTARPV